VATLRLIRRDGRYTDVAAASGTNLRAVRRDGRTLDFQFATGKEVRFVRRDGSYFGLNLASGGGGTPIHPQDIIWCSTCNDYALHCPICDWYYCGHNPPGATPCPSAR